MFLFLSFLLQNLMYTIMNILPFINRNGLWYLDEPDLREPFELGFASLAMAEKGISELLEAFAIKYKYKYKIKDNMVLGFSGVPLEKYDARLDSMNIEVSKEYEKYPYEIENIGETYLCTELFGNKTNVMVWLSPVFQICLNGIYPKSIYLSVLNSEIQG